MSYQLAQDPKDNKTRKYLKGLTNVKGLTVKLSMAVVFLMLKQFSNNKFGIPITRDRFLEFLIKKFPDKAAERNQILSYLNDFEEKMQGADNE